MNNFNTTTSLTPAKAIDKKLIAAAKAVVASMTKGDAAVQSAKEQAEAKTGLSTKQACLKLLDGRNSAVTEKDWQKTYAPAVVAALNEAYPDGYGPRLSHIRVMVIGISNGIDGPAGRRQYYEATLPILYDRGLLAKGKAGRPASTTGGKVTSGEPAKGSTPDAPAVPGKGEDKVALPTFAPGKAYSDGDLRQAALLLFGSPAFADKLLKIRASAELTEQLKKAVNAWLAS